MKKKLALLGVSLLSLTLVSCGAGISEVQEQGTQNNNNIPTVEQPQQGADEVDTPAAPTDEVVDPHSMTTSGDFNIYLYSSAEYHKRNWVWLWSSDATGKAGAALQTAADRMALTDTETNKIYIVNALCLDFNTNYKAYSDFNLNQETTYRFESVNDFDWLFFRSYVSHNEDGFSRRSGEYHLDSTKMVRDGLDGSISIYINEDVANQYTKQEENPGIYYTFDAFVDSFTTEGE